MNFYQFMIPRLNGEDIEKDFVRYRKLVEKGIAGFIIFGGKLKTVRQGVKELQKIATTPLIIASDLEQGLGQQIEGGTIFPPAMAIASAIKESNTLKVTSSKLRLLRNSFKSMALEAKYAGINTIFAPVLDVNTNPDNPIISTRAFGEDARTVSFFGCEMIRIFQANGIAACAKHFPGHGDTSIDSHIGLPSIKKNLRSLKKTELLPFMLASGKRVKMLMLGHLKVPAMDPSGIPVSLSPMAVKYIKDELRFKGLLITDALNMGGIGKYPEEKAALMALMAGVDLLLHPTDPAGIASYLGQSGYDARSQAKRLYKFRENLKQPHIRNCDFKQHKKLSMDLAEKAIKISGQLKPVERPMLVILNDSEVDSETLIHGLKLKYKKFGYLSFRPGEDIPLNKLPASRKAIAAVFSTIKAWKGGPSPWLLESMKKIENSVAVFISFGSPYLLSIIKEDCTRINAYWGSPIAQKAIAKII